MQAAWMGQNDMYYIKDKETEKQKPMQLQLYGKKVGTSFVCICNWSTFRTFYFVNFKFNILDLIECNILGRNWGLHY